MIIVEKNINENNNIEDFEKNLTDGRLVEPSEKLYRLREVVLQMRRLGRMLTTEELKEYELTPEQM